MQYMTTPEITEGLGAIGQIRQGPDGQLYQLTQTVDGLGNIGFAWLPLLARALPTLLSAGRALAPAVAQFASQAAPIAGQAVQQLAPILSEGLGEDLYDQPQLGEVRVGPDGQMYQYTQTVDGLGNLGIAWLPLIAQAIPAVASVVGSLFGGRGREPSAAPAVPVTPAVPAMPVAPAAPAIDWSAIIPQIAQSVANLLATGRRARGRGLGETDDLYQVAPGVGIDPDEPLGLTEEEALSLGDFYLGADGGLYEFQGLDEDLPEELPGIGLEPDEPLGLTEEEALGITDEELASGVQGYLRETPGERLQGYVPGHPPAAPPFVPSATPSPLWQSLW